MDLVIGTRTNPAAVDRLVAELKSIDLTNATLYVGYPILSTADRSISLDGILTSVEHGIIIFDLSIPLENPDWNEVEDRQAELEIALKSKLIRHKELTERRELAVPIHVLTYVPRRFASASQSEGINFAVQDELVESFESLLGMSPAMVRPLNAAIQQVTTIKPLKKRLGVRLEASRGGKLKLLCPRLSLDIPLSHHGSGRSARDVQEQHRDRHPGSGPILGQAQD